MQMKKYIELFSIEVEEKILAGKTVYCLDKHLNEVFNIGALTVKEYLEILASDRNRYYFWIEEEEETK